MLDYYAWKVRQKGSNVRGPLDLLPELEALRQVYARLLDELYDLAPPRSFVGDAIDSPDDVRQGGRVGGKANESGKVSSEPPAHRFLDMTSKIELIDKIHMRVIQTANTIGMLQAKYLTMTQGFEHVYNVFKEGIKLFVKDKETQRAFVDYLDRELNRGISKGLEPGRIFGLERQDTLPSAREPEAPEAP